MFPPVDAILAAMAAVDSAVSGCPSTVTWERPLPRGRLSPVPEMISASSFSDSAQLWTVARRSPSVVPPSVGAVTRAHRTRRPRETTCSMSTTSTDQAARVSKSPAVIPGRSFPKILTRRVRASEVCEALMVPPTVSGGRSAETRCPEERTAGAVECGYRRVLGVPGGGGPSSGSAGPSRRGGGPGGIGPATVCAPWTSGGRRRYGFVSGFGGRYGAAAGLLLILVAISSSAQTTAPSTRKPVTRKPAVAKPVQAPVEMACQSPLGSGVTTKRVFCDVLTGRDPKEGIIVKLPPHRGELTLTFDLHNRHTYSEDEVRMKRGFASYTATIGVLTLDNTLLTRAVIASEFRNQDDLVDRITGGAGPGGVKAVAPVGTETISLQVAANVTEVSLLGEKLTMVRADGVPANYSAPGRPIAIVSNAAVEYTPAPAPVRRRPAGKD